ncbi:MAG TPA: DNA methyltransferase [Anaerolineaceae bacterium]|nr:DNA methyltransferase [Anaerolineaceae bacterium]HPK26828.1 DNA methyltransferase [Anaerolineaceae bacterium]
MKTLYYGDNLEILRNKIPDNSVDLCYIDPPFNSKRSYFQIYNNIGGSEDKAQAQAFVDTWSWDTQAIEGFEGITTNANGRFTRQAIELIKGLEIILKKGPLLAYLVHMTLRVTEIFRVLKPTGSFYLHCDPTASHYLKLVLDAVFCSQGGDFLNEIVWYYGPKATQRASSFQRKHDVIFLFTKSKGDHFFTCPLQEYSQASLDERDTRYKHQDDEGRYRLTTRRDQNGNKYRAKVYLNNGVIMTDVWQIPIINATAKERMGYPTQKPEALLERIIKASSNPGDVVLDAYCGCGTTVAVANRLDRQWIGIDITYHSIGLILKRLADANGGQLSADIVVDGIPQDIESARALANREDDRVRKEFEKWAVLTYTNNRGVINEKKGADKGIDGVVYFATGPGKTERMIIQVKSGGANRGTIATIKGDMQREKAELATLITMDEPTRPMIEEAKTAGLYAHPIMERNYDRIRIVTVREIIEQGTRIDLPLSYDVVKPGKRADEGQQLLIDL